MRLALISLVVLGACTPLVTSQPDAGLQPCFTVDRNEIDFGELDGGPAVAQLRLANQGSELLFVDPSPVASPFRFDVDGFVPTGFSIAPGSTTQLRVIAETDDGLVHLERLVIAQEGRSDCTQTVNLRAQGIGRVSATDALDFGNVDLGAEKTLPLTLRNTTRAPVTVWGVDLEAATPGIFSLEPPSPTTSFVVPARGAWTIDVRARAALPVRATGSVTLRFGESMVQVVPLTLIAGTPRAELEGAPIVIPELGFREAATPRSFAIRNLRLRNVGTGGAPEAQLRLVAPFLDFEGNFADGGTPDLEVEFGQVFTADAGATTEFAIRVQPPVLGPRTWHVKLLTNAPQPPLEFDVSTNAVTLPDCTLNVPNEAQLDVPADGGVAAFTLRNVGTTRCVLDHLVLDVPPDTFAVVDGGFEQLTLMPGQSHQVLVVSVGPLPDFSFPTLRYLVFGAPQFESTVTLNRR